MEYVRWHHYVPDKLLQGFVEPVKVNGLIKKLIFGTIFQFKNIVPLRNGFKKTILKTFSSMHNVVKLKNSCKK